MWLVSLSISGGKSCERLPGLQALEVQGFLDLLLPPQPVQATMGVTRELHGSVRSTDKVGLGFLIWNMKLFSFSRGPDLT